MSGGAYCSVMACQLSIRWMSGGAYCSVMACQLSIRRGIRVSWALIYFKEGHNSEAYERINRLEPDRQYRWEETTTQEVRCDYLAGRSPRQGSAPADDGWNGRNDPLLTTALQVVREALETNANFDWNLKPMFRLQMAYLLLWSSSERYASLRDRAVDKVMQIADDQQFALLLK
jgi:hypothetical protein